MHHLSHNHERTSIFEYINENKYKFVTIMHKTCQSSARPDPVRFPALSRIKPHAPRVLWCPSVNSFKFHTCVHTTPGGECLKHFCSKRVPNTCLTPLIVAFQLRSISCYKQASTTLSCNKTRNVYCMPGNTEIANL